MARSRRIEDAVHKLKEHESVNRQTRRRLEETSCNMRDPERVHPGLQYRHAYTRMCALHARDITISVNVNGEASEILGRSYCNMSRRLLKSAGKGNGRGRRGKKSVFLFPRHRVGKEKFCRGFSNRDHFSGLGEVIGCVSS